MEVRIERLEGRWVDGQGRDGEFGRVGGKRQSGGHWIWRGSMFDGGWGKVSRQWGDLERQWAKGLSFSITGTRPHSSEMSVGFYLYKQCETFRASSTQWTALDVCLPVQ